MIKETDAALQSIVNLLNQELAAGTFKIEDGEHSRNKDGRIASVDDEQILKTKIVELANKLFIDVSIIADELRPWYDFSINTLPVNIKSSDCKANDNVSSKKGIAFAITGKIMAGETFKEFWRLIEDWYLTSQDDFNNSPSTDYYYLVYNKLKKRCFWTSARRLKEINSTASNFPFQASWGNNFDKVDRNNKDGADFLLSVIEKSNNKKAGQAQPGIETVAKLRNAGLYV